MRFKTFPTVPMIAALLVVGCLFSSPTEADQNRELPAWTKTVTKSQGADIERMHHELEHDQSPYKKTEARTLNELNEMTILEDVEIADVYAKIDELMAAKTQIMRLRYDHLIAMRRILSDEQKTGYDKGVLKRSAVH